MNTNANFLLANKTRVPGEFDRIAHKYDLATFLSQGYMEDLQRSVARMKLTGTETLLDLCCGTGKSTLACLKAVPLGRVIGVDNSSGMLSVASKNLSPFVESGQLQLQQQDAMNLDFPPESFDAVFMSYGIRNMPDYRTCLTRLFRLLKPGGTIGFHDFSLSDSIFSRPYWILMGYTFIIPLCAIVTGSAKIFHYLVKSVRDFHTPRSFLELLSDCGFEAVETHPQPGWRKPILRSFVARKPHP